MGAADHRQARALHPADPGPGGGWGRPAAPQHEFRQHDPPRSHALAASVRPGGPPRVSLTSPRGVAWISRNEATRRVERSTIEATPSLMTESPIPTPARRHLGGATEE